MMIKKLMLISAFQVCTILLSTRSVHAQEAEPLTVDKVSLVGTWEIEGTIMGEGGEGWVMPHKQSDPDCGKDHTVFKEDNTASEVKYGEGCIEKVNSFKWELSNENVMHLTMGERTVKMHIVHLDGNSMRVGIQVKPDSRNKMYVAYKRKK